MLVELILELAGNAAYKRSRLIRRATMGGLAMFAALVVCGLIYAWASA
jgi:hypothetical protein